MAVQIIIIGVIMLLALVWQFYLIGKDGDGAIKRMYPPLILGAIIFLGCTVWGIIRLSDSKATYGFLDFLKTFGKGIAFFVSLNLKSYLGPLVLGATLSVCAYHLLEYGEFRTIPILSSILEMALEKAPVWLQYAYGLGLGGYAAFWSLHDGDIFS